MDIGCGNTCANDFYYSSLATFKRLRKGLLYIEKSNFITYGKEFKNAKEIHSKLGKTDKKVSTAEFKS